MVEQDERHLTPAELAEKCREFRPDLSDGTVYWWIERGYVKAESLPVGKKKSHTIPLSEAERVIRNLRANRHVSA